MTKELELISQVVSCDLEKLTYLVNSCKVAGRTTQMDIRGIVSLGVPLYHHMKNEPVSHDPVGYSYASLRRGLMGVYNKFNQ